MCANGRMADVMLESGDNNPTQKTIVVLSVMMVILDDDEVFVGNHQILAVDLAQDFRLQDLMRRAESQRVWF